MNQDYQFWTRSDEMGNFSINNVRTGNYNLNAWVPGFIGDYQNEVAITITSGSYFFVVVSTFENYTQHANMWHNMSRL